VSDFVGDVEVVDVEESRRRDKTSGGIKLKVAEEKVRRHQRSRNVSNNSVVENVTTCSDSCAGNVEILDTHQLRRSLTDRVSSVGGESTTSGTDANNVEARRAGDVDQAVHSLTVRFKRENVEPRS